jgi:hypothetical protein
MSLQMACYQMFTKVDTIMAISHVRSPGQGQYGLIVLKRRSQKADPHPGSDCTKNTEKYIDLDLSWSS